MRTRHHPGTRRVHCQGRNDFSVVLEEEFVGDWKLRLLGLVVQRVKLWLSLISTVYVSQRRAPILVRINLGFF